MRRLCTANHAVRCRRRSNSERFRRAATVQFSSAEDSCRSRSRSSIDFSRNIFGVWRRMNARNCGDASPSPSHSHSCVKAGARFIHGRGGRPRSVRAYARSTEKCVVALITGRPWFAECFFRDRARRVENAPNHLGDEPVGRIEAALAQCRRKPPSRSPTRWGTALRSSASPSDGVLLAAPNVGGPGLAELRVRGEESLSSWRRSCCSRAPPLP